tara:strand:+ start:70524 stop:72044 length:1521 start_codon:yes stop_codon:yes gene_type:complete
MNILKKIIVIVLLSCVTVYGQEKKHKTKSILQFGAIGDSITLNTKAIQAAINNVSKHNGGRVVFPKGTYLSGSLELKSGVEIHFEDGAVLLGSTDPYQYRKLSGNKALLLADKTSSIAITGNGIIDGQGRKLALTTDSLHHAGVLIDPKYNYRRMRSSEIHRAELINFRFCNDIKISGITLKDGSSWIQTYDQCTNLEIDSIKVNSTAYWNNDGFDIVDCKNVSITNCDVNAADDGICLKSHSADHFNDQILIANCRIRSSANAVKFGTASKGGFKNVTIKDIEVYDTYRSAVAIESVDGGVIENINVSNITAVNTGNPFFIRLGHRSGDKPGHIKNVSIKNVNVQVPFGRPDINYDLRGPEVDFFHNPFPSSIAGIPGYEIENVTLENITISYPGRATKGMAYIPLSRLEQVPENIDGYPEFSMFGELPSWGFYVRHVKGISFKNIKVTLNDSDFRPAFVFDDVENINLEQINLPNGKKEQVVFKNVLNVNLDDDTKEQKRLIQY